MESQEVSERRGRLILRQRTDVFCSVACGTTLLTQPPPVLSLSCTREARASTSIALFFSLLDQLWYYRLSLNVPLLLSSLVAFI